MSRSFGWTSPTTTTDGNGFETEVEIQITVATSLIFFFQDETERTDLDARPGMRS